MRNIRGRVEWPTVVVIGGTYAAFAAVLFVHQALPWPVTAALLGLASMQHSSLQHEVIHRHPTPWQRLNELLVWIPVGLTVPYERFRATHLDHHANDESLTDPILDPESNYITPEQWARTGRPGRIWLAGQRTLAGRLILGPARSIARFWLQEARSAWRDNSIRWAWVRHVVGATVVILVVRAAELPLWIYALGAGYVALSLISLRAFAEHRAVPSGTRSAMVRTSWFFQLLYLNNSLHHTHHAMPSAPWYRLPSVATELASDQLAADGAGLYNGGYLELARRFMFRPFCQPVNPLLEPEHSW